MNLSGPATEGERVATAAPDHRGATTGRNQLVEHDYYAFADRHIGPDPGQQADMLRELGFTSLDELSDAAVPPSIRDGRRRRSGPLPLCRGT